MTTIMPHNELVRRAAAWISGRREADPGKKPHELLDEAGMRFNLSPIDQRMLADLFARQTPLPDPSGSGRTD